MNVVMNTVSTGPGTPAPRNAPGADSDAEERNDACPVEFQPESGALGPREGIDEAELEHDRRDDL
jgi:hypothetical protein